MKPRFLLSALALALVAPAAAQAQQEECDTLRDRLSGLDIDALSPREALDLLYDLKREAGES